MLKIFKVFKKYKEKRKEIEHLKKLRNEKLADAAYWFCEKNYQEYAKAAAQVLDINQKLIRLRRRAF